jgi:type IV pilus assembly protein PilB
LCDHCKEAYAPTQAELENAGFPEEARAQIKELYRPGGCPRCGRTGFRSRMGLYEVMPMSEDIERMAAERRSSDDIRRKAIEEGMITLREDGMAKAVAGETSLDEIFRVVM